MNPSLNELKEQIDPMERFVELFARSWEQPKLRQINLDRGFRYASPDIRHYCLLKLVRVISALNAAIELARTGYAQEHAKYPEIMDLYGGIPGCFHQLGMRGTPKDAENLETIQTFINTASNAIALTISKLNLFSLIETDPFSFLGVIG